MPLAFSVIHLVFHVFMLCQYNLDECHMVQYDPIELDGHLTYIEELEDILYKMFASSALDLFKLLRFSRDIVQLGRLPKRPSKRCESSSQAYLIP